MSRSRFLGADAWRKGNIDASSVPRWPARSRTSGATDTCGSLQCLSPHVSNLGTMWLVARRSGRLSWPVQ
jgi:hypothetical protein